MFASELNARASKLQAEQKARIEREKQKLERERILAQRVQQRKQQHEDEQRRKRMEELAAKQAEEDRIEQQTEHNRGVFVEHCLRAIPMDEGVVASKGIKRGRDKVMLPPSVGNQLMDQGAPRNGAMFFELRTTFGSTTHTGVLEFTAPEGVIMLPKHVIANLFGPDGECYGQVRVGYRRLEKCTHVRLQPRSRAFHELVPPEEVEGVLEGALRQCSALTEGDWVQAHYGGEEYQLRVLELQPAPQVSVIDTDVSADVGPSLETEELIRIAQQEEEFRQARFRAIAEEREAAAAAAAAAAASQASAKAEALQRRRAAAAAAVPAEPPADTPAAEIVSVVVRFPDGARAGRRFRLTDAPAAVFNWVDSTGGGGSEPGGYALVAQFPRRVLAAPGRGAGSGTASLAAAGLAAGQEVLFLEPVAAAAAAAAAVETGSAAVPQGPAAAAP